MKSLGAGCGTRRNISASLRKEAALYGPLGMDDAVIGSGMACSKRPYGYFDHTARVWSGDPVLRLSGSDQRRLEFLFASAQKLALTRLNAGRRGESAVGTV